MDKGNLQSDHDALPSTKDCSEAARRYAITLADRVKSFGTDPLHSVGYLSYLAKYLKAPLQKPNRRQQHTIFEDLDSKTQRRPFVVHYLLQKGQPPTSRSFDDPRTFANLAAPQSQNEILFLAGRPSADWLNYIGSKYSLDHRFFYQHLGPVISGGHRNAGPDLPSRSLQVISLRVPTIVYVGAAGRNLEIRDLEIARGTCNAKLRKINVSMQDSAASEVGRSILRGIEVFDGSTMVIEQQLTATIVQRGQFWTAILWNDAGNEGDHSHIPIPSTKEFAPVASELAFCAVFFEKKFTRAREPKQQDAYENPQPISRQPLSLLNAHYGGATDWTTCATNSPLAVLRELFEFKASSALQYLNMLEHVLSEVAGQYEFPSYEYTNLETIVQYDYVKASLSRFQQHYCEVLAFLMDPPEKWLAPHQNAEEQDGGNNEIINDLNYLISRAKRLLKVCDEGKTTLMSNNSVQEAKRSTREAELVHQLTKATNRLTFIFLPISFVTSIFGMNFKQFGQGPLSIWIWAVVTIPLLIISILIVEKGRWIKQKLR